MKKAIFVLSLLLAFALLGSAAWASDMQPGGPPMGQGDHGGMRGGPGGGMMSASTDPEIQAVLDENADKFEQHVFDDPATGISLEYSLYIPEGYDESASYPLLMFIPDATGAGKTARQIVEQYYGAAVWVTDEDQAKHASFVLVPAFSETVVNDDWSVSEQVETAVNLIAQLQKDYSIDANRLYTTGQSMGCMTSLYLNSKYPDLFAASPGTSGVQQGCTEDEVMAMLDADGVPYSFGTWSAQNSSEEQVEAVNVLLAEGNPINMVRFETGTVFKEGESGMEHMASFNYGYRLSAVRDWLFAQSK